MKKTLTLLLAAVAAFSMNAANFFTTPGQDMGTPMKMENVKQAPAGLQAIMVEKWASKLKATPNFPATTVDDMVGGYDFVYRQYTGGLTTQPDTLDANSRDQEDVIDLVGINKIDDSNIRITGMFVYPVQAEMGTSGNYTTFTIDDTQTVYYHSTYGACNLQAVWYYEGDDTYEAGWYLGDIVGYLLEQGIMFDPEVHFYMVIASGTYAGYRLGWVYEPASYMVPDTDYNAIMTYDFQPNTNVDTYTYDYPVAVNEDENYVVTVNNFGGVASNPITLTLAEDKTWAAAEDQVLSTTTNGDFVLYGTDGEEVYQLTGTGTETVLTFDSDWTGLTTNNYWYGQRGAATITRIDDDIFVYPGEEPTSMTEFYLVGTFNSWSQEEGMLAFAGNEAGDEYTITTELEAGAEFKVITPDGEGWKWFGGQDDNGVGYFLITSGIEEVSLVDGANIKVEEGGEYTFTIKEATITPAGKAVSEPLVMTVSKTSTAINTIDVDAKADNAYYNLMGVKFNSMPTTPGIYIHNGKKVLVK